MKNLNLYGLVVLAGLLLAFAAPPAQARGVIVYNFGGIAVDKVADLPDTDEYKSKFGYLDLGWAQKEYSLFWMPLWKVKGEGYILYVEKGDTIHYSKVDAATLKQLASVTGKTLPDPYPVSFLSKIWGWAVAAGLLIVIVAWGKFTGGDDDEAETA